MIKAVIDIGTNSVKLCIGNVIEGKVTILKDINEVTKLGEGMQYSGFLREVAIKRTILCVNNYVNEAKDAGAVDITIVGTMAIRTAKNVIDFEKRLKELTNIDLKIISGAEEAHLSFLAVLSGFPEVEKSRVVTFDTGGGSTEFVFGDYGSITREMSINVGAIRLTEKYFTEAPISKDKLNLAQAAIEREISEYGVSEEGAVLIGMGGTLTTMAAIKAQMEIYDAQKVQGSKITLGEVISQIEDFASKSIEERSTILGLNPARASIILAGACIVCATMNLCNAKEVLISDRGLRHLLLTEPIRTQDKNQWKREYTKE